RLLRRARRLDLGEARIERARLAGPGPSAGGLGEAGGEREALGGELLPALGGGEREERASHLALDRAAAVGEQVLGVGHVVLGGRDAERRARGPRTRERFVERERSGGCRPAQRGAQEDWDECTSRGSSRHHTSR